MLFHYLILISVPQMLPYTIVQCTNLFFFFKYFPYNIVSVCALFLHSHNEVKESGFLCDRIIHKFLKLLPTEYISLEVLVIKYGTRLWTLPMFATIWFNVFIIFVGFAVYPCCVLKVSLPNLYVKIPFLKGDHIRMCGFGMVLLWVWT